MNIQRESILLEPRTVASDPPVSFTLTMPASVFQRLVRELGETIGVDAVDTLYNVLADYGEREGLL